MLRNKHHVDQILQQREVKRNATQFSCHANAKHYLEDHHFIKKTFVA